LWRKEKHGRGIESDEMATGDQEMPQRGSCLNKDLKLLRE
jgi:hypothetical protein